MAKSVSLSVHKNTVANHRKRDLARDFGGTVEALIRENDIRAMAFIGIGADGRAFAKWDTGGIIPLYGFPETLGAVLAVDVTNSGVQENFIAPISGGLFARKVSK